MPRKERAHMGFVGTHSCLNVAARLYILVILATRISAGLLL